MKMKENILIEKTELFAVRIVNLCKYLVTEKRENIMSTQLLRCGTSIGANLSESQCAQSRQDFLAKVYISFKECNETKYWLKLLYRTAYLSEKEYNSINKDCMEILKMLVKVTKTVKENKNGDKEKTK